jgi:hypothetical protein
MSELMKAIETEFGFAGHRLRQIWRKEHVAVYERSLDKTKPPHELELIIIRIEPESQTPTGSIVPELYGWSFPVRMKEWVLTLTEKLYAIKSGYGGVVREAMIEFKGNPGARTPKAQNVPPTQQR